MIELIVIAFLLAFLGFRETLSLFFSIAVWFVYGVLLLIALSTEHYVVFGLMLLIPLSLVLGSAFAFVFWLAYGVGLIVALVNGYWVTSVLMMLFPFALVLVGYIIGEVNDASELSYPSELHSAMELNEKKGDTFSSRERKPLSEVLADCEDEIEACIAYEENATVTFQFDIDRDAILFADEIECRVLRREPTADGVCVYLSLGEKGKS